MNNKKKIYHNVHILEVNFSQSIYAGPEKMSDLWSARFKKDVYRGCTVNAI